MPTCASQPVQHIERAHEAVLAAVQAVVVRRADQVKSGVAQRLTQGVRRIKRREACIVRPAGERGLQVDNGIVRLLDPRLGKTDHRPIVVGPALAVIGVAGLRHVAHGVAAHRERGHEVGLLDGLGLGWVGGRSLCLRRTAAGEQQAEQDERGQSFFHQERLLFVESCNFFYYSTGYRCICEKIIKTESNPLMF